MIRTGLNWNYREKKNTEDYPQVFCFLKQQSIQSRKTVINKHYLRVLSLDRFCFNNLQGTATKDQSTQMPINRTYREDEKGGSVMWGFIKSFINSLKNT